MKIRPTRHVVLALLIASAARGEGVLPHCDLDTLFAKSAAVVRAEVGGADKPRSVKVLAVFKGSFSPGQTISVPDLSAYKRCRDLNNDDETYEPLRSGDVVYLFFEPARDRFGRPTTRPDDASPRLISMGIRLLSDGRVYGFAQYFPDINRQRAKPRVIMGSLGLVTMTPATFPDVALESQAAFEDRLKSSPARIEAVERLLNAPVDAGTKDRLLAALRERSTAVKAEQAKDDEFGERLAYRYGDVASPEELMSALREFGTNGIRGSLERGFRRPAGRAFVLDKVADARTDDEARMRWISTLRDIGWDYQRDVRDSTAGEADFVTKMARVAVTMRGTKLLSPMLNALTQATDRKPTADSEAAAELLAGAFADASVLDRFALAETLMQISPAAYAKVLPNAGPCLTLVEPNHDRFPPAPPRTLRLNCRFRNQLKVKSDLKLVLRPKDGGPERVLALAPLTGPYKAIGDMTNNFGSAWRIEAQVPADVSGPHFAFLRNFVDGKPTGDGLGCDVIIEKP